MTSTNHPAPESERKAIARIIDPVTFEQNKSILRDNPIVAAEWKKALRKADAILSRMGGKPVAWLYESWIGENSWSKHFSFEKPAGNNWQRNIVALYASPPTPSLDASKPHKTMTAEEYATMPIIGWHEVCRDVDECGGVGFRFLGESPPAPALDARTVAACVKALEDYVITIPGINIPPESLDDVRHNCITIIKSVLS